MTYLYFPWVHLRRKIFVTMMLNCEYLAIANHKSEQNGFQSSWCEGNAIVCYLFYVFSGNLKAVVLSTLRPFPQSHSHNNWCSNNDENSLNFNFALACRALWKKNIWFSVWRSATLSLLLLFRLRLHFTNELFYCFIVNIRDTSDYTWNGHFEESFMFGK